MRIITWNLNHGKAAKTWPELQAALGADIMFLQETRRLDQGAFAWEPVPHHDRGSAVVISAGDFRPVPVIGYEGWVVGGEWLNGGYNDRGRPIYAFSIHSPTSNASRPRRSYVEEVGSILSFVGNVVPRDADLIVGGDFNFVSLGERAEPASLQTTAAERECLAQFFRLGLISCWEAAHTGHPLAQTLRWCRDKAPNRSTPYHCDGIFVPASWQNGIMCEVLTSKRFEVSDHYPVAAWITIPRADPLTE